jgi:hypothetical protein
VVRAPFVIALVNVLVVGLAAIVRKLVP